MKTVLKGALTGLFLQLAIGPVFFFVLSIAVSSGFRTALFAIVAVTLVDYIYIALSLAGVGTALSSGRHTILFSAIGALALIAFGALSILSGLAATLGKADAAPVSWTPAKSFVSAFALTISSPVTIVFWGSVFSAKAVELNLGKRDLARFGFGAGFATFAFMSSAMALLSALGQSIPPILIRALNCLVGAILVFYGAKRLVAAFRDGARKPR